MHSIYQLYIQLKIESFKNVFWQIYDEQFQSRPYVPQSYFDKYLRVRKHGYDTVPNDETKEQQSMIKKPQEQQGMDKKSQQQQQQGMIKKPQGDYEYESTQFDWEYAKSLPKPQLNDFIWSTTMRTFQGYQQHLKDIGFDKFQLLCQLLSKNEVQFRNMVLSWNIFRFEVHVDIFIQHLKTIPQPIFGSQRI